MTTIRLGVIGIGNMGTTHCKKVLEGQCPDFTLTAICDINPARIAWAKENFNAPITYFEQAEDMLRSGLIDACIIAVPHYDHPQLAMACMEKGVLCLTAKDKVRLLPPLNIPMDLLKQAVSVIAEACK